MSAKQASILNYFKRSLNSSVVSVEKEKKSSKRAHSPKERKLSEENVKVENSTQNKLSESESEVIVRKKRRVKTRIIESDEESDTIESRDENGSEKHESESETTKNLNQTKNVCGQQRSEEKKSEEKEVKRAMKSSEERNENKGNSKEEKCSSTVDFLSYKPSKSNYDPIKDAAWQKGEKVPYLALAKTFQEIETVSSRLKMIEILGNYLWSVKMLSPSDLLPSIYLALNKLGPDYEGVELGIGDSLIIKALAEATGRKADQIKNEIEKKGDLGLVAESSRGNQKVMFQPPKLILSSVFAKLKEIATMSGQSSMSKKVEKVKALLVACRDCEARYLVRSLTGKLRIGLAEQSLLVSLARCILLSEDPKLLRNTESFKKKLESATQIIKTTYCECPNYDKIVDVLLQHGIEELPNHCHLTPGIPLKPMLAHPTKGVSEILKRFENSKFTCEYKYDGERAQIHLVEKEKIFIFSRNQENNTSKYPELLSRLTQAAKENVVNYILDCEAVAWDKEKKQILPFQVLSTRKRKDAKEDEIKVKVCLFAFDLLFFNGKSLVTEPLRSRRDILRRSFKEIEGEFMFAASKDFDSIEEVQEFLDESIRNKCEGLMVKSLDNEATYEIAKRSHSWLKLKKDYLDGVGDTIDTVVIGGYYGKGKRTGNFGGYLLATYDPESEEFQAICKIGTGFKDEDLEKHSQFFRNHIISDPKSYYSVDESIKPDVWFDAVQVWEVKCADLSVSPIYRAAYGMIEEDKGISLRFPRFIRIREDKKPEDATDAQEIAELYSNQEIVKQQQNNDNEN